MFGNEKILKEIRAVAETQDKLLSMLQQHDGDLTNLGLRLDVAEQVLAKHREALNLLERKMVGCNNATARCRKAVTLQQEQIDALSEKVNALLTDDRCVIWEDDRRVGIDRKKFRRAVERMHVPYRAALRVLDDEGRICCDSEGNRTRPAWSKQAGKLVRAVVVYK